MIWCLWPLTFLPLSCLQMPPDFHGHDIHEPQPRAYDGPRPRSHHASRNESNHIPCRWVDKLKQGISPFSKCPRSINKPLWGEAEKQLVLRIYGKEKIAIIIVSVLFERSLITKSLSAPRPRKKRNFNNFHVKPWTYKDYKAMELGECVQIDHMTVSKNGITCKHF